MGSRAMSLAGMAKTEGRSAGSRETFIFATVQWMRRSCERRRSSGRHRDLEPARLLKAMSVARSKAGCARFLTLIHSRHRPER